MDRTLFNRMNSATTCAKCRQACCEHTDAEWLGRPDSGPAAPAATSRAVQHRAGLYSEATGEPR